MRKINTSNFRSNNALMSNDSFFTALVNNNTDNIESNIQVAEVIDVIYSKKHKLYNDDNDIGKILYKRIFLDESKDVNAKLYIAYPANFDIIQYPIKHEIVLIITALGKNFYILILNYLNKINNNSLPGLTNYNLISNTNNSNSYNNLNVKDNEHNNDLLYGNTFKESNNKIKGILPEEGDTIIYGRFGNIIKLGNHVDKNNNYGNIKLSNGFKYKQTDEKNYFIKETINTVDSLLWITSGTEVADIKLITNEKEYFVKSSKHFSTLFSGNQITLNTDRIIMNSKINEIGLFANSGILLNTNGYLALDSFDSIGITTNDNITIKSNQAYINSKNIFLGSNANEPIVLGNKLVELLSNLLDALINETHMTGVGVSSPPVNKLEYIKIKRKLNILLSKFNKSV